MKEFANDNFKFDENGGKLSKRVENTVGKGAIARYEQFLLSPSVFDRLLREKPELVWEGIILLLRTFYRENILETFRKKQQQSSSLAKF